MSDRVEREVDDILLLAADIDMRLDRLAEIDAALGCDETFSNEEENLPDCRCAKTGRHFTHECLCGKSWIRA